MYGFWLVLCMKALCAMAAGTQSERLIERPHMPEVNTARDKGISVRPHRVDGAA